MPHRNIPKSSSRAIWEVVAPPRSGRRRGVASTDFTQATASLVHIVLFTDEGIVLERSVFHREHTSVKKAKPGIKENAIYSLSRLEKWELPTVAPQNLLKPDLEKAAIDAVDVKYGLKVKGQPELFRAEDGRIFMVLSSSKLDGAMSGFAQYGMASTDPHEMRVLDRKQFDALCQSQADTVEIYMPPALFEHLKNSLEPKKVMENPQGWLAMNPSKG